MSGWNFCPELNSMPQCYVVRYKRSKGALKAFRITGVCEYRALPGPQLEAGSRNPLLLAEMKPAGSFQPHWKGEERLKDFSSSTAKLCSWKRGNSNTGLGSKAGQVRKLPVPGEMVSLFSVETPASRKARYSTAASLVVKLKSSHWLWCNNK